MRKGSYYQYYVEGKDEKCLLEALKMDFRCIESGRIEIFNVIQNKFSAAQIRPMKKGTNVILVYDTDVEKTDVLEWNVKFLEKQSSVNKVFCVPQVKNLEDELIRACQIKSAKELTGSISNKEFKRDLIHCSNLGSRLKKYDFKMTDFWNKVPQNKFYVFGNEAAKIRS